MHHGDARAKFHVNDVVHCCFVKVDGSVDLHVMFPAPHLYLINELGVLCIHLFGRFEVGS